MLILLKDIFCQDKAIGRLQQAFAAGRLAHAYIFAGPDGVGKRTTAQAWAKMLLCRNRTEKKGPGPFFDSCGGCGSCQVFEGGAHPDYHLIEKELRPFTAKDKGKEAKQNLPISVIREFLLDKVAARPAMGDRAVFVIRESEKLNASSQNALLKALEEPPKHCFIILLCSRADKLLPTTLSRCQTIRFGPVDEQHITAALSRLGVGKAESEYWARFSDGQLGQAITWATLEPKETTCYKIKTKLIESLARHELSDSLELADWMLKAAKLIGEAWAPEEPNTSKTDINRRAQKGLLRMIITAFNDAMKLAAGVRENLVNADQAGQIEAIGRRFDAEQSARKIATAYESARWIEANVNEKLIFEQLLLNLADSGIISGLTT